MTTWTFWSVSHATCLFVLAGIAEIGGGWLIWQHVRGSKPWWWSVLGGLALVIYGFIPTLQHLDDFGRLYAVYGGFFIGLAFAWSYYFDDFLPGCWGHHAFTTLTPLLRCLDCICHELIIIMLLLLLLLLHCRSRRCNWLFGDLDRGVHHSVLAPRAE